MSQTSDAFDAAIQRLLPLVGTQDHDHTEVLTGAILRLVIAADQHSLACAKQSLADALTEASDNKARAELGTVLEALICCPPAAALFGMGQDSAEEE